MNKYEFDNLAKSARDAMKEVHQLSKKIGHNDWMDTIESQLEFIEKHAINEKNPVKMLSPDQEFTYGIISSRQLASPDEMRLKEKLNQVTNNLRDLWD
jgi:DNA-binding ferritin-like protein (Dps family)